MGLCDNYRRSGKTFRKVLEALKLASEGKWVLYIGGSHQILDFYIKHFFLPIISTTNGWEYHHNERRLLLPGGGKIWFINRVQLMNPYLWVGRCKRPDVKIYDD